MISPVGILNKTKLFSHWIFPQKNISKIPTSNKPAELTRQSDNNGRSVRKKVFDICGRKKVMILPNAEKSPSY